MSRLLTTTPHDDGFRMPAEWEPHVGCWMLWPERSDNWRGGAKPAQRAFAAVAAAIAKGEPVTICVSPAQYVIAREMVDPAIRLVEMTSNDSWIRDCGPTFVVNDGGDVRGVDWQFNAWGGLIGGLYFPWDQDDLVGEKVIEMERDDRYAPAYILEGGSIDVDGEGTLIVTEQCLLNPNRNPNLTRAQIEMLLRDYLGVVKILWLKAGVYLDETDGHTDNFCRFVAPGEVILTWTDDRTDPQYDISSEAFERLQAMTDARGRKLKIHKLHQPDPAPITAIEAAGVDKVAGTLPRQPGDRLAASYVNFYIANDVVVMPRFDDPHDHAAATMLGRLFPGRRILTVPGREILLGGGNIHCITQQEPLGHRGIVRPAAAA
ncbi:agmatine deiminase [Polymorphobacter arshaanensis]|uniref:Putative agmatine deiminase n=1 Tax=Glacieibacterium arshaanense TaxID=2511025 RepID=A0A4Y9EQI2_9SPHN|nr:agmatine deiminase [Polymorphobacter arshaanensis]TFU05877.1 agmatine deiminase [Polymorphobacter arshaanensis]